MRADTLPPRGRRRRSSARSSTHPGAVGVVVLDGDAALARPPAARGDRRARTCSRSPPASSTRRARTRSRPPSASSPRRSASRPSTGSSLRLVLHLAGLHRRGDPPLPRHRASPTSTSGPRSRRTSASTSRSARSPTSTSSSPTNQDSKTLIALAACATACAVTGADAAHLNAPLHREGVAAPPRRSARCPSPTLASCARAAQPFEHLVLDFLAYLEFERGLSRNTLEAYRSRPAPVRRVPATGATRSPSRTPTSPASSPSSPPATARSRRSRPRRCSARSRACAPSTATCAARASSRTTRPRNLRAPKQSRRLPQVLSRDEVAKLLEQPRGTEPAGAARPRAARADVRLRPARLGGDRPRGQRPRPRGGILRARGKGSKERLVPVGSAADARASTPTCAAGRPKLVGDRLESRLFVNHRGSGPHPPGPLQDRPAPRRHRRPRRPDEPAHAAPHLRHPPARRRLRPALACRRCSATPTSPPPSSTRTSPPTACGTSTSTRTRAPRCAERARRGCHNRQP